MNTIDLAYRDFCEKRFPLPTEDEIAPLEARIGIAIPPDYRRFLLTYNGGIFREPIIMPDQEIGRPRDRLTFLNGIGAGPILDAPNSHHHPTCRFSMTTPLLN